MACVLEVEHALWTVTVFLDCGALIRAQSKTHRFVQSKRMLVFLVVFKRKLKHSDALDLGRS